MKKTWLFQCIKICSLLVLALPPLNAKELESYDYKVEVTNYDGSKQTNTFPRALLSLIPLQDKSWRCSVASQYNGDAPKLTRWFTLICTNSPTHGSTGASFNSSLTCVEKSEGTNSVYLPKDKNRGTSIVLDCSKIEPAKIKPDL